MVDRELDLDEQVRLVELELKRAELASATGHRFRLAHRKAHMEQFRHSRDIQWKINVALWTLLSALLAAGYSVERDAPVGRSWLASVLAFLTVLHLWWLILVQVSLESDKSQWQQGENELAAGSRGDPEKTEGAAEGSAKRHKAGWQHDLERLHGTGIQWVIIQWLFTATLSFSAWMLLSNPPSPTSDDIRSRLEALERDHLRQAPPPSDRSTRDSRDR